MLPLIRTENHQWLITVGPGIPPAQPLSASADRGSRTITAGSDFHRPRSTYLLHSLPTPPRGRCSPPLFPDARVNENEGDPLPTRHIGPEVAISRPISFEFVRPAGSGRGGRMPTAPPAAVRVSRGAAGRRGRTPSRASHPQWMPHARHCPPARGRARQGHRAVRGCAPESARRSPPRRRPGPS